MPKIVDKVEKRNAIALSSEKVFLEKGIDKTTISDIAKEAGVGKGTIYEYFENKEDILCQFFRLHINEKFKELDAELVNCKTVKEKFILTNRYFINPTEDELKMQTLHSEYFSVALRNQNRKNREFNTEIINLIFQRNEKLIKEAIESGEVTNKNAKILIRGLTIYFDGAFLFSNLIENFNLSEEINSFIDAFFEIL